jgi:hypothetical protein
LHKKPELNKHLHAAKAFHQLSPLPAAGHFSSPTELFVHQTKGCRISLWSVMRNYKHKLSSFITSFVALSLILAMGPYLTLNTAPSLGTLLTLLP